MILTVRGDLSLPAFLPIADFTKEVLYQLSHSSICVTSQTTLYDYMFSGGVCQ